MANQKISQLPAATSLTGAELIELVQGGVNVQSTVSALGGQVSSQYGIAGGANATIGSLGSHLVWMCGVWNAPAANVYGSGNIVQSNGYVNLSLWQATAGLYTAQPFNGAGSNLANSIQMGILASSALANQAAYIQNLICGITGSVQCPFNRVLANGCPVAGATMVLYFTLAATNNVESIFMGFYGQGSAALSGTTTPSTLLNSIGVGKDSTDTNLSFMINNGSGTAQKSSLGVTHTSLANQLLRLVITCDGFGNVTITLSNMESGGLTYSASFPTATAKLPAAQAGTGSTMAPLLYVNNGGQASAVSFGFKYIFLTTSVGA